MALRFLWRLVSGQAKATIKNYNAIARAEKVLDTEKTKVAPRHPGTEAKFQVLIKGDPYRDEEKKPMELLDRLKTVKVSSQDAEEDPTTSTRPLPQDREIPKLSTYGFEEPKIIPEGKCSLKQALAFITKYQNDPNSNTVESLSEVYKMKQVDVENVLTYFRVFEIHVPRDPKKGVAQVVLDSIGVSKVIKSKYHPKFAHLEENIIGTAPDEKNVNEK